MDCMPTREEEDLEDAATGTLTDITGLAMAFAVTVDRDLAAHRIDTLEVGEEIPSAVSTPLAADTIGTHASLTTTCKLRETGGSSITVGTVLTRIGDSERVSAVVRARATGMRRRLIVRRTQALSAANSAESLPEASAAVLLSATQPLRTQRERRRARAVPIFLAEDTRAEDTNRSG